MAVTLLQGHTETTGHVPTTGRRVGLLLLVLAIANAGLYFGVFRARDINREWLHGDRSVERLALPALDRRIANDTDTFLSSPCEFGSSLACGAQKSYIGELLKSGELPPLGRQLVTDFGDRYSSRFSLLRHLAMLGADADVAAASAREEFWGEPALLVRHVALAEELYLQPARRYATAGREWDAAVMFRTFLGVVQPAPEHGRWLSLDGVDATDLPVVTSLFCPHHDRLQEDLCLVGLLTALEGGEYMPPPYPSWVGGVRISNAYAALPSRIRIERLASYLRQWEGDVQITPPADFSNAQAAAWFYAAAVRFRAAARATTIDGGCMDYVEQSVSLFQAAFQVGDGYFSESARRQLVEVAGRSGDLCRL